MSLFEEYSRIKESERKPIPNDLTLRSASEDDIPEMGRILAEREGGNPADHIDGMQKFMAKKHSTGNGQALIAESEGRILGVSKLAFFSQPREAPESVAPSGWYLGGVVVRPEYRRRKIGHVLTLERLKWIAGRDRWAYYFANERNRVSIEMHEPFGFVELTRNFTYPGVIFEGGEGILFRVDLREDRT